MGRPKSLSHKGLLRIVVQAFDLGGTRWPLRDSLMLLLLWASTLLAGDANRTEPVSQTDTNIEMAIQGTTIQDTRREQGYETDIANCLSD